MGSWGRCGDQEFQPHAKRRIIADTRPGQWCLWSLCFGARQLALMVEKSCVLRRMLKEDFRMRKRAEIWASFHWTEHQQLCWGISSKHGDWLLLCGFTWSLPRYMGQEYQHFTSTSQRVDFPLGTPQIQTCMWLCQASVLSLSHRTTSKAELLSREAGSLEGREIPAWYSYSHSNSCKAFAWGGYKGKSSAWGACSHCTSRLEENANSQDSNNEANIYPGFINKGKTMSLGTQCVQNPSYPCHKHSLGSPGFSAERKGLAGQGRWVIMWAKDHC